MISTNLEGAPGCVAPHAGRLPWRHGLVLEPLEEYHLRRLAAAVGAAIGRGDELDAARHRFCRRTSSAACARSAGSCCARLAVCAGIAPVAIRELQLHCKGAVYAIIMAKAVRKGCFRVSHTVLSSV
jgi:hypothetical protein